MCFRSVEYISTDKTVRKVVFNVKMADLPVSEVRFVVKVNVIPENALFLTNLAFFSMRI